MMGSADQLMDMSLARPYGGENRLADRLLAIREVREAHREVVKGLASTVFRKERLSYSVPFHVYMPYASYFFSGDAMHAYPSVPAYPASHGCVRLSAPEAPIVYDFAVSGTPVRIF